MEPSGNLVRLCITPEDKEVLDVVVHEDDTIWALKIKIFELMGVFPAKQSISFKDPDETGPTILQNEKLIKDYNLKSGSHIFLSPRASTKEYKTGSSPPQGGTKRSGSSSLTRGGGFLGLLSKKVAAPKMCFALGRGLKRAVVGCACSFNIHKVDSRGKQIKSEDDFEIEIIQKDKSKATLKFEKSNGMHSVVVFTPVKNGDYRVSIKFDGVDIANSPYRGVAIDETTPKIAELAFSQDWVPETTQLYTLLSQRAETVDNIFLVGHEGLLHLMRNASRQVQSDMTSVFACLVKKDDNKARLVREMGLSLLKLLKTDYWTAHLEIKCFVSRFLVILAISEDNCCKILDEVGTLPLALLARTPNPECSRGCAKVLSLMSVYWSTRLRLVKENVFSIMYTLMHQEDIITTYDTFYAIANLCHIDDAQGHILRENMTPYIVSRVNSENMNLRLQALKILSVLSAKPEFSERLYTYGLHNTIVQHAEGFMAGLVYQWETQSTRLFYEETTTGMVELLKAQFKDDIGCAQYSATILANMHQHNREEMGSFIVKGACLRMLRRMARSADVITQIESCKVLAMLSSPDQPQEIKETLISGGVVIALLQAITPEKPVLLGHIVTTLTNLCKCNRLCLEAVSAAEVDKLLDVLREGGAANERSMCFLLGSMVAIDKHRIKIVHGGGHTFFTHLIDLVRLGELDLLPEIDQSQLQVIKKIGRGVSGVVWKAEWKGQIVAVKSFNESNIAFNVDEFASEMALMSVLRHQHVVHCLGGSRWAKKLFLVSEYFARGSLYEVLHKQKTRLTIGRILQIAIGAASGLEYLHSLGLIHRDVKTGNLLIAQDWTVKVGDFGVSRVVAKRMTRAVGTPCYMAPEVLEGQDYTQAADVYSYAFVIWEMVTRETPFKNIPHLEIAKFVVEEQRRPDLPVNCPEPLSELIQLCWHPTPSKRPNFSDVLKFLENTVASSSEAYLETVCLPGNEEVATMQEEEQQKPTSKPKNPSEQESLEYEKEWEMLCQQYKSQKSKVKTKESMKGKGKSDLNLNKSNSGHRKEMTKTLSTSKDHLIDAQSGGGLWDSPSGPPPPPPPPPPPLPYIPLLIELPQGFASNSPAATPVEGTPLVRPRSFSALPLLRVPLAGDPQPDEVPPRLSPRPNISPRTQGSSPRTQDSSPRARMSPRTQESSLRTLHTLESPQELLTELSRQSLTSTPPPVLPVIAEHPIDEATTPVLPSGASLPPQGEPQGDQPQRDQPQGGQFQSGQSQSQGYQAQSDQAQRDQAHGEQAQGGRVQREQTQGYQVHDDQPQNNNMESTENSQPTSQSSGNDDYEQISQIPLSQHESSDSSRERSPSTSPRDMDEQTQDTSTQLGRSPPGSAPKPAPRKNTGDSQRQGLSLSAGRATPTRHHHVPSPKLYRSNTAPHNRPVFHAKSFTSSSPPSPGTPAELFTNVVLKPAPRRPPYAPWSPSRDGSGTDSPTRNPHSPRSSDEEGEGRGLGLDSSEFAQRSHTAAARTASLVQRSNDLMGRINSSGSRKGEELHRGNSESMLHGSGEHMGEGKPEEGRGRANSLPRESSIVTIGSIPDSTTVEDEKKHSETEKDARTDGSRLSEETSLTRPRGRSISLTEKLDILLGANNQNNPDAIQKSSAGIKSGNRRSTDSIISSDSIRGSVDSIASSTDSVQRNDLIRDSNFEIRSSTDSLRSPNSDGGSKNNAAVPKSGGDSIKSSNESLRSSGSESIKSSMDSLKGSSQSASDPPANKKSTSKSTSDLSKSDLGSRVYAYLTRKSSNDSINSEGGGGSSKGRKTSVDESEKKLVGILRKTSNESLSQYSTISSSRSKKGHVRKASADSVPSSASENKAEMTRKTSADSIQSSGSFQSDSFRSTDSFGSTTSMKSNPTSTPPSPMDLATPSPVVRPTKPPVPPRRHSTTRKDGEGDGGTTSGNGSDNGVKSPSKMKKSESSPSFSLTSPEALPPLATPTLITFTPATPTLIVGEKTKDPPAPSGKRMLMQELRAKFDRKSK